MAIALSRVKYTTFQIPIVASPPSDIPFRSVVFRKYEHQ